MNNSETLQKIIASYCDLPYTQINLSLPIKDRYVVADEKEPFSDDVCNKWNLGNSKCTDLHNKMFDKLESGDDILDFVQ
jgi:hypothetical protein